MDSDLWIARLAAAKRKFSLQQHQSNISDRLNYDEFEMEEEARPDFSCPYCYEDHDIDSLCSHLEEEHPFESKVVVCSICSMKVTKDMLNHITVQHGHLFKLQRRRRLRKFLITSGQTLSLLGKDLCETHLQVLLGNGGYRPSDSSTSNSSADSLLSSLLLNFPISEGDKTMKPSLSSVAEAYNQKESPLPAWKSSIESSLTFEERERRLKQARVRTTFVRDLVLSNIFGD